MSVFEKVVRLHTLYPRWPSGAPVLDANLTGTTGAAGVAGRKLRTAKSAPRNSPNLFRREKGRPLKRSRPRLAEWKRISFPGILTIGLLAGCGKSVFDP